MKKQVAVIILNWNGEEMLRRFLPQVVANTSADRAEVIVADNGSTDGSLDLLARSFPEVTVIRFDKNHGFAEGYNLALAQVDNPLVVLLNSDVAPAPGWVDALSDFMDANPQCAACQPKILSVDAPDSFEYAGACGGFIDRNGYPFCRGRIFDIVEKDAGQYDRPIEVDWASGAALMVRRDLFLAVGGLDPLFFAHQEEIDLCWRFRAAGHSVWCVPAASVFHLGGGSLPQGSPKKAYLNFRNNLLLIHKNLPPKQRSAILRRRSILDFIAAVRSLVSFDFKGAKAIIRARRDFKKMRSEHYPDSVEAQTPNSTVNLSDTPVDQPIGTSVNILREFYLRRHKTFSSLPAFWE